MTAIETSTYEWRYITEDEGHACDRCGSMTSTAEVPSTEQRCPPEYLCVVCNETELGAALLDPTTPPAQHRLVRGMCQGLNLMLDVIDNVRNREVPF